VDPETVLEAADPESGPEEDFQEICQAFLRGRLAHQPPYAVEAPFTLLLDGRLIRGRIDAVYDLAAGDPLASSEGPAFGEPDSGEPHPGEPGAQTSPSEQLASRGSDPAARGVESEQRWRYRVVDWKTGTGPADPWQLAVYRLAWADLMGVPPSVVDAVFYHVRDDRVVRPRALPDHDRLADLLG
jgi:DNA helicase-2/ATP-dependent DNA helicase PcrA